MTRTTDSWKTATEAAETLGVSVSTVRQWANEGRLPCYRTSGGHRRFRITDLDEFLGHARAKSPTRRRLRVLEQTTQAVSSRLDLDRLLSTIPKKTLGVIDSAAVAALFLYERDLGRLVVHSAAGFEGQHLSDQSLVLGEGIAGKVLLSRRPLRLSGHDDIMAALANLQPANRRALRKALGGRKRGNAVLAVPLLYKDDALGVLLVASLDLDRVFSEDDLSLLQVIASQVATAIENAKAFEQIKKLHLDSLKILIRALNAKDYYSYGHSMRVSAYAQLLGRDLNLNGVLLGELAEAASLHDIGKVGLADELLLKSGGDAEMQDAMREHPLLGATILSPLFTPEVLDAVRHHHETWDGSGYPAGYAGGDIPALARLLAVVNFYDSKTIPRAFLHPLSYQQAREQLMLEAGRSLDPHMVDVFMRALEKLRARRDAARAIAAEAAAEVDAAKHELLREPQDMETRIYQDGVAALRKVRAAHPEVRFLTTVNETPDGFVFALDAEEDPAYKSQIGDGLLEDGEMPSWFAGERPDRVVVSADDFGVWVSGYAPLRGGGGKIAGVVCADMPALEETDETERRHSALTQMMSKIGTRMASVELQAISDGLTGLYNHRYFHERLQQTLDAAIIRHETLAVLFLDLDDLKTLNDTHGHSAGDATLVHIAKVIQNNIRGGDIAARYGGDEFAVILPDNDAAGALHVAERIRRSIERATVGDATHRAKVTISVGLAVFPEDGQTKEDLLDNADWAMYQAKSRGKNRVYVFSHEARTAGAT
jgi:diguanylate cyclase (GGDEF)-like protein/excisionase family DNA binding protein